MTSDAGAGAAAGVTGSRGGMSASSVSFCVVCERSVAICEVETRTSDEDFSGVSLDLIVLLGTFVGLSAGLCDSVGFGWTLFRVTRVISCESGLVFVGVPRTCACFM